MTSNESVKRQNRRNRQAGKTWERDILNYCREYGFDTERTRDTGTKDEGDLVLRHGGRYYVVEAKNARMEPTGFLNEAEVEREHFRQHRNLYDTDVSGVVFVKRRGKGSAGDGIALMTIDQYLDLIQRIN